MFEKYAQRAFKDHLIGLAIFEKGALEGDEHDNIKFNEGHK